MAALCKRTAQFRSVVAHHSLDRAAARRAQHGASLSHGEHTLSQRTIASGSVESGPRHACEPLAIQGHGRCNSRCSGGRAASLSRAGVFPPVAVQLARVGEETGQLYQMLESAASALEADSHLRLERLLTMIVPAAIILMGLVVAVHQFRTHRTAEH